MSETKNAQTSGSGDGSKDNKDGYRLLMESESRGILAEISILDKRFRELSVIASEDQKILTAKAKEAKNFEDFMETNRETCTKIQKETTEWGMLKDDLTFLSVKVGTLVKLLEGFTYEQNPTLLEFCKNVAKSSSSNNFLVLSEKIVPNENLNTKDILEEVAKYTDQNKNRFYGNYKKFYENAIANAKK